MYDPHTKDSRGFAFVTMNTVEDADAAVAALNGTELSGKTMRVEKVRFHSYSLLQRDLFARKRPMCPVLTGLVAPCDYVVVVFVVQARRGRARTPTPGRYHGPPKPDDFRRGPPPFRAGGGGGGGFDRPYDPKPYDSRYAGQ